MTGTLPFGLGIVVYLRDGPATGLVFYHLPLFAEGIEY